MAKWSKPMTTTKSNGLKMMIDETLLSDCHRLFAVVAPEVVHPVYIVSADTLGDLAPRGSCLGWAGQTDGNIQDRLGRKWSGPGSIISLDDAAIAAAAAPGSFEVCTLSVLTHEVAHLVLARKPAVEILSDSDYLQWR